jgi:hypothetical protein
MIGRLKKSRSSVPNLVIAQRVVNKMADAAKHFLQDETGEAMVGLIVHGTRTGVDTLYVLDTIAPDENAVVREWATFQQGDERQDELIYWLQENWHVQRHKKRDQNGKPVLAKWDVPLRYLGDWHKQPGFMVAPSGGDLMTALNWIDDRDNGMDFLLAPIVTLGHPASAVSESGSNYIAVSQGDDTAMRVDFWYIDRHSRDFYPINPSVYPDDQLPALAPYPWHLVNEARFKAESELLEKDGLFTTLILWDTDNAPPLDVCFLTVRMGSDKVLLIVTPYNYPAEAPRARVAPFAGIKADEDIYKVFGELWKHSKPVKDPVDWKWSEGRHLIDYIFALEESLGIKHNPQPSSDGTGAAQPAKVEPTPEEKS